MLVYCVRVVIVVCVLFVQISQLQGYQPAFHPTTTSAHEQGVPSESYLQEVKKQLENQHEENQHERKTRSASDDTGKECAQSVVAMMQLQV